MPWISEERLNEARKLDLLTYLRQHEPHELVCSAPGEYRTKSHGSLVISNGLWDWNRGQVGGRSALSYLMDVRGLELAQAVEMIEAGGGARASPALPFLPVKMPEHKYASKTLVLPEQTKLPTHLLTYLQGRGINADEIRKCLADGSLYEGRYNGEAVCVFVGRDEHGTARFGCMRGINSDMKRDCAGSDKRFGFRKEPQDHHCGALAVYESPIDALSHLCLYPESDAWRLSLGGTSDAALIAFLDRNPGIERISLCLDADDAGRRAAHKIQSFLNGERRFAYINVRIDPPCAAKDYNDALLHAKELAREQKETGHRKEAGLSI